MSGVTRILEALPAGEPRAVEELLPLVYGELRRLAARHLARERPGQTLQPTALVHEAWLRLVGGDAGRAWSGRAHFFGAAAEAMRRIPVETVRRKLSLRRGRGAERVDLEKLEPHPLRHDARGDHRNRVRLLVTDPGRVRVQPAP